MPGARLHDGIRTVRNLLVTLEVAKRTGDWPGAEQQWKAKHTSKWVAKPFWDDAKKEVLPGCKARMEMCCEALKVTEQAFVGNALFLIYGFEAFWQMFPDLLHLWCLGVFDHFGTATQVACRDYMFRWTDKEGRPILPESAWKAVCHRITERLLQLTEHTPGLVHMSSWVGKFVEREQAHAESTCDRGGSGGGPSMSGAEAALVSFGMPLVLAEVMQPEMRIVQQFYERNGVSAKADIFRTENEAAKEEDTRMQQSCVLGGQGVRSGKRGRSKTTGVREHSRRMVSEFLGVSTGTSRLQADCGHVDSLCVDGASSGSASDDECVGDGERGGGQEGEDDESEPVFCSMENVRRNRDRKSYLRKYREPTDGNFVKDLQRLWFLFLEVFLLIREPQTDEKKLEILRQKIVDLKEGWMELLPYKSGELMGWNFPKCHELDYVCWAITQLGHLEAASAQYGEHVHTVAVKKECARTNRNQATFGKTVLVRDSMNQLNKLIGQYGGQAVSHDDEQQDEDSEDESRQWGNCDRLSVPVDLFAQEHIHSTRVLKVPGGPWPKRQGTRRAPEWAAEDSSKRVFVLALSWLTGDNSPYVQDNADMGHLQETLAKYLWSECVQPALGEAAQACVPDVDTLNDALNRCLPSKQVALWCCLQITNKKLPGYKCRIRAYPWSTRKFHHRMRSVSPSLCVGLM